MIADHIAEARKRIAEVFPTLNLDQKLSLMGVEAELTWIEQAAAEMAFVLQKHQLTARPQKPVRPTGKMAAAGPDA